MKTKILLWLFCTVMLTGCMRGYDIKLNNGSTLHSARKPKLNDRGYYIYKGADGKESQINAMRVIEIDAK